MHPLLPRWLQARGFKSVEELSTEKMPDGSPTERDIFETYNRILSEKDELDAEGIKRFCDSQLKQIKEELKNTDNVPKKIERLVLLMNVYDALIQAIESPKSERESVEKYLLGLLESK